MSTLTSSVILAIHNHHNADCGDPPEISEKPGVRTCYFTNRLGEQLFIQYDPDTKSCRFWGGDLGWEERKVEKFRDRWLVLNAQKSIDPALVEGIRKEMRDMFGEPRLTDQECDYVAHSPGLGQGEYAIINAFLNEVCE